MYKKIVLGPVISEKLSNEYFAENVGKSKRVFKAFSFMITGPKITILFYSKRTY